MRLLAPLLLIGCSPMAATGVPGPTEGADTQDPAPRTDSGGPQPSADTAVEWVPGQSTQPHPVFREDLVHAFELSLSDQAWADLAADAGTYVQASFVDGSQEMTVGVRRKGWSSAQSMEGKPSFKVDIDRYVSGQRYHGLEAFDLHAELTDAAALSEWAAYRLFRDQGLPASRTGWASLHLNGQAAGFYTVVEKKDDQLISHWWSDTSGSLYESSSESWPCDLDNPGCDCFEMDESGAGDTRADLALLCETAAQTSDPEWLSQIRELVPWGPFLQFMATEIALGAHDHYAGFSGNFYLYHEPATDHWWFIPSSMNNQFGSSRTEAPTCSASDWTLADYQHGLLAQRCWSDEACADELVTALWTVAAHVRESPIVADIEAAATLIRPYVAADPKSPWSPEQFDGQVACIQAWLEDRPNQLAAMLPEPCLGEGGLLHIQGGGTLSENQRCDRSTPEAPAFAVQAASGRSVQLTTLPTGIAPGDEVLVAVRSGGEDVGAFALALVDEVDGTTLTLSQTLPTWAGTLSLQRVPSFDQVKVDPSGILQTGAWDGAAGGILAFRTQALAVAPGGQISMDGRGYRGGATGPGANTDGYQGEGTGGGGMGGGTPGEGYNAAGGWWAANTNGGGALVVGGGGDHAGGATAGDSWDGQAPAPAPGLGVGTADVGTPQMGGGGGGVARIYDNHGPGGAGGGIVLIWAEELSLDDGARISAAGAAAEAWTRGTWTYGAGGGAGGTIWLAAERLSAGPGALDATGGTGFSAVERVGGDGGLGRVRVDCLTVNGADCGLAALDGIADPDVGWSEAP